ncbi:MAG: metallophosphoesterase [Oscillospiraceae bacterium]|nr:metallophosphoesterase [Oscillospiraceae bacterium]
MKLLLLGDTESRYLWDYYRPGKLAGYDLILSTGDLKSEYLSFLVTMGRAPLLYVHGNHDGGYAQRPPEGCDCIEDELVKIHGLRILGLGGSVDYNGGAHQYSERQMQRRIRRLRGKLRRAGGVDIVLTHSPARGLGDGDDYAHRGFRCFTELIERYEPRYFIHSHVHMDYGWRVPRCMEYGKTTVINAYDRYELEIQKEQHDGA